MSAAEDFLGLTVSWLDNEHKLMGNYHRLSSMVATELGYALRLDTIRTVERDLFETQETQFWISLFCPACQGDFALTSRNEPFLSCLCAQPRLVRQEDAMGLTDYHSEAWAPLFEAHGKDRYTAVLLGEELCSRLHRLTLGFHLYDLINWLEPSASHSKALRKQFENSFLGDYEPLEIERFIGMSEKSMKENKALVSTRTHPSDKTFTHRIEELLAYDK